MSSIFEDIAVGDHSYWEVIWNPYLASYSAERWYDEEANIGPDHHWAQCPGPEWGLFDDLEAVEIAMGFKLPDHARENLLAARAASPPPASVLADWGVSFAMVVYRSTPDGQLVASYGPTGAVDTGWLEDLDCGQLQFP